MAEGFLNALASDRFEAQSAGIEPGTLNGVVVDVMKDAGIDISSNKTKSVQDVLKAKRTFDYIITVCDEISAKRCPVFPGDGKRVHMGFEDPSSFSGDYEKKYEKTLAVSQQIKVRLQQWIKAVKNDR